jgi:hypothetical protein
MMLRRVFLILLLTMTSSCARKAEVRAPEIIRTERFLYMQDDRGRWLIVTTTPKDLDEAMKQIHAGPASVNKLDLWVITPLGRSKNDN